MKFFDKFVSLVAAEVAKSESVTNLINSTCEIVKNSQDIINSQDDLAKEINIVLNKFDQRIAELEKQPAQEPPKSKKSKAVKIAEVK